MFTEFQMKRLERLLADTSLDNTLTAAEIGRQLCIPHETTASIRSIRRKMTRLRKENYSYAYLANIGTGYFIMRTDVEIRIVEEWYSRLAQGLMKAAEKWLVKAEYFGEKANRMEQAGT